MDSSIISALGGGSGIDTTSLVNSLIEVERAPQQNRIDSQKEKVEAQISAYGTLKSALSEFQSLLEPLASNDTFNSRSVSVPDTTVITATEIAADAQVGSYQIEVEAVAKQHTLVSNITYSDKDAAAGLSGNLEIKLGTWTYTGAVPTTFAENEDQNALSISIDSDDSIQAIADKINEADSDVLASVLLVDGQYQLMISAPSGGDNALQITGDDASLSVFEFNSTKYDEVTETQQGQDAEVVVNGLSVFRSSNEVDDVVPGLTFSLNKASPDEVITFSISEDKASAETAIRNFVEGYNALIETFKGLTGVSTDEETNQTTTGDLYTDGSAKALLAQIRSTISAAVPGVDTFNALTNVGIRTQLDGTLEIDEDDFDRAIADQFDDVAAIFAPQTSSSTSSVDVGIGSYASETVAGTYSGTITTAPTKGSVISDSVFAAFDTTVTTGDYTFSVTVDGTSSDTLTLAGNFTTAEELRVELQSLINNDANIKAAGSLVDVVIDGSNIKLQSRTYGATSEVSVTADPALAFATQTGLSTNSVSTDGVNAEGTIEGETAFGSGNVLLPALGSDPYGLNLTVKESASGDFTFNFSRGFAGEMSNLIDSFLASNGTISNREERLNNQLDDIADDQTELDRKMAILDERLTAQYTAMEAIIASLNTTSTALEGMLANLPLTASKD